jgi:hypothetical protein
MRSWFEFHFSNGSASRARGNGCLLGPASLRYVFDVDLS